MPKRTFGSGGFVGLQREVRSFCYTSTTDLNNNINSMTVTFFMKPKDEKIDMKKKGNLMKD